MTKFAFPTHSFNTREGMTLRDYFAGQVLAGMWSGRFPNDIEHDVTVERVVEGCYRLADAMLKEREKDGKV